MAKKDSAFLQKKAEVLRSLGIEATPISELTVVDLDYNKNQLKAAASAKGLSEDDYMKDVDALAKGDEAATAPGVPANTKEAIDIQRDPSVRENAPEEPKEEEAKEEPIEGKASVKSEVKSTESKTTKSGK